jgi:hypothetical protein
MRFRTFFYFGWLLFVASPPPYIPPCREYPNGFDEPDHAALQEEMAYVSPTSSSLPLRRRRHS